MFVFTFEMKGMYGFDEDRSISALNVLRIWLTFARPSQVTVTVAESIAATANHKADQSNLAFETVISIHTA